MKMRMLAAALALAFAPAGWAADEENPFKKAKVGDFATYKMATKISGVTLEGVVTQTVISKDDKEAVVELTGKVNNTDIPPQKQTIDLSRPYNPSASTGLPTGVGAKVERLKEGKEKVKVGMKDHDTTWETYKVKLNAGGTDFDAELRVWQDKSLALPLVKMEMSTVVNENRIDVNMEMTATGNNPPAAAKEGSKDPDKKDADKKEPDKKEPEKKEPEKKEPDKKEPEKK